jgi:hypothetical protein
MVAGGGNKIKLGYSLYNTIFAGTGNTVDFTLNTIFAGRENSFENNGDYYHTDGLDYLSSNPDIMSILSGSGNTMEGSYFMPKKSVIVSGLNNKIFDKTNSQNYIEGSGFNTILNGSSNLIEGVIGLSWIGNGFQNEITNSTQDLTVGNYIVNGSGNTIEKTSSGTYNYNTIIGGTNNKITNKNNSVIVGSNLTALSSDTTHVNRLFFNKNLFFNDYTYSAYTGVFLGNFNHKGKSIGIIKLNNPGSSPFYTPGIQITLENGYYDGQILYLIAIPYGTVGSYTFNVFFNSTNVIGYKQTTGQPATLPGSTYQYITINNITSNIQTSSDYYTGLAILIWNSTISKWIRADFRGGI